MPAASCGHLLCEVAIHRRHEDTHDPACGADAPLPGVVTVGAIDNMLLNPLSQQGKRIHVPGETPPKGQTAFDVDFSAVDSGAFGAMGVSVLRGRGITAATCPARPGSP